MKINNNTQIQSVSGVNKKRSILPIPIDVKTTGKASKVIPLWWGEVLPGDTIKMNLTGIVRFTPNIHPTLDNAYIDIYGFFVPNRLLWKNWEKFITLGNNPTAWTEETGLIVPTVHLTEEDTDAGKLANYLGIPKEYTLGGARTVYGLPFRAYNKIINDWFVNLNVEYPVFENTGDDGSGLENNYELFTAQKLPDLFTLALPSPQRGPAVSIPLGDYAPVVATEGTTAPIMQSVTKGAGVVDYNVSILSSYSPSELKKEFGIRYKKDGQLTLGSTISKTNSGDLTFETAYDQIPHSTNGNLYADLANASGKIYADLTQVEATTINQLRLAFQTQAFLELNARCGNNRYVEYLKSVFGVTNGDSRLQRAEYLFGTRNLLNVNEITQTSSTTSTSPLGEVGGKVVNVINEPNCYTKSFTEHGIIMYMAVVRNKNSYSQGINRKWFKKDWLTYYNPVFDNIGEVGIYTNELYARMQFENQIYGFQEAWYEYRYGESIASGYFGAGIESNLLAWTYGDIYETAPTLTSEFLKSSPDNIERTLAIQGQASQWLGNFLFDHTWTRPMAVHSIPGRIDHI